MARFSYGAVIGAGPTDSRPPFITGVGGLADIANASAMTADQTAFEAALATLVADGASPTQAHVTAANSAYTTLKADFGAVASTGRDVLVSLDAGTVKTRTSLAAALRAIERMVSGSNSLTP